MDTRSNISFTVKPVGDCAVLAVFGDTVNEDTNAAVTALERLLKDANLPGVGETIPAFASLLIHYDPLDTDYRTVADTLIGLQIDFGTKDHAESRTVDIPVCYGGEYGEDLGFVARHSGLSEEDVIALHSGRTYRIYMLGFLPGFPYLGGLDERLYTPRLSDPRTRIPAGSIGIGGEQTGIYPLESPGGWQLIGRTPLKLFDPEKGGSLPYKAGDFIRFVPIRAEEFRAMESASEKGAR
jgi:inhibitor of KinA